jgi:uncharacterized membrane protein
MKRILMISIVLVAMLLSSCTSSIITQNSIPTTPAHPNLEITGVTTYTDEDGYFDLQGEVVNAGDYDMKDVKVIATFYDGSKNLVGTVSYTEPDVIPQKIAALFKISSYPNKIQSASYHLDITANMIGIQP